MSQETQAEQQQILSPEKMLTRQTARKKVINSSHQPEIILHQRLYISLPSDAIKKQADNILTHTHTVLQIFTHKSLQLLKIFRLHSRTSSHIRGCV